MDDELNGIVEAFNYIFYNFCYALDIEFCGILPEFVDKLIESPEALLFATFGNN